MNDTSHQTFIDRHVKPAPGRALVVGSRVEGERDWRDRLPGAVGVDMRPGPGVDVVCDLEKPLPAALKAARFKHVDCVSVLEHSRRPWVLANTIEGLLRRGGSLYLSVPFIWRWHGYPADYWRMTHQALPVLFPSIKWQQVCYISAAGITAAPGPDEVLKQPKPQCGVNYHLSRCELVAFGNKVKL